VRRGELEGRLLVLVTLGLTAFGLVMVYSATSAAAAVGGKDPSYYLKRQGIYALLGLGLLFWGSRRDYRKLKTAAPTLLMVSLGLLLVVLAIGQSVNGARRWISFGPAAFQPSELAKIALAVWVSAFLAGRKRAPRTMKELLRPVGAVVAVASVLILAEPDLGTVIAIVVMVAAILLVSGTPGRLLATATTLSLSAGLFAIWLEPYRRARVFAFLNPWGDSQGAGFQTVQAMIGLGSGGLFGVGLGQGVQKVFYLPEAHTDMIFAIIGEELGLVGAACVMAAYATFAYAGLRIALACRDPFGKRLATGITVLVCAQAAINLAAVMSLAPLTGIPLPFVSYGGSSLVVLLGGVGILLNIAHGHGAVRAAQVPDRSRGDGRTRAAGTRSGGRAAGARGQGDVRRVAGSRRSAAGS
jgi:cell division protein FtsW